MKRNTILTFVLFILVLVFASTSLAADEILFAVVGPMSGDSAALGIQERQGAEIAAKEINDAGGINGKMLKFIVGDDQANPNQATIVAQKFTDNEDILFVVGHVNSSCSISSLPIYQKVNLPLISGANSNPVITRMGFNNYFRTMVSDAISTKFHVDLVVKELGCSKPAIIWENTDYGKGMRDVAIEYLPQVGITKIYGDESYVPGIDRDYSAQITKFKGAGADSVIFLGEYTAFGLFIVQSKNLDFNAEIIATGGAANPKFIEIAGPENAEGIYVLSTFDPTSKDPKAIEFAKKFEETFGNAVGEWGANAYDVVSVAVEAIKNGGTTRETLIEQLHEIKAFHGVTGLLEFDEYGDVPSKKSIVLKVVNGELEVYTPTKF